MSLDQPQTRTASPSLLYHCDSSLLGSIATVTLLYPASYGYRTEFKLRTKLCELTDEERWALHSSSNLGLQVEQGSYGNMPIQDVITGTHQLRHTITLADQRLAPSFTTSKAPAKLVTVWLQTASSIGLLAVGDKAGLQSTDGYIRGMAQIIDLQVKLPYSA